MLKKFCAALLILLWLSPPFFPLAPDDSAGYIEGETLKIPDPFHIWNAVKPPGDAEIPISYKASAYSTSLHTVADHFPFRKGTKQAANAKSSVKLFKLKHAFRI